MLSRRFLMVFTLVAMVVVPTFAHAAIDMDPYLTDLTRRGVTVIWQTTDADGKIFYGEKEEALDDWIDVRRDDEGFLRGKITCLKPNTKYFYQVQSGNDTSIAFPFTTAVEADTDFSFVVYGDSRSCPGDHGAIVNAIAREHPLFTVHLGDMVENELCTRQWLDFFRVENQLIRTSPEVPVIGNHETMLGSSAPFRRYWHTPDHDGDRTSMWRFQQGNSFFIVMDSSRPFGEESSQYAWVRRQLGLAQTIPSVKHCFVLAHLAPYSRSFHGRDSDVLAFRDTYAPLFKKYDVDVVFGAHDHNYQHNLVDGIHYIVTGGGGAPLRNVRRAPRSWTESTAEKTLNYVRVNVSGETLTVTAVGVYPNCPCPCPCAGPCPADCRGIEQFSLRNRDYGGAGAGSELPDPCTGDDSDD